MFSDNMYCGGHFLQLRRGNLSLAFEFGSVVQRAQSMHSKDVYARTETTECPRIPTHATCTACRKIQ